MLHLCSGIAASRKLPALTVKTEYPSGDSIPNEIAIEMAKSKLRIPLAAAAACVKIPSSSMRPKPNSQMVAATAKMLTAL